MTHAVKLYDGPALSPARQSVGLWSADPAGPHVLHDQTTNVVIGSIEATLEVDTDGVLTVGDYRLGPERIHSQHPSARWQPSDTYTGPELPDRVAVVHTTTRVLLLGSGAEILDVVPAGQLRSIGAQRMVATAWGATLGFLGLGGCAPCDKASRRLLEDR